MIRLMKGVLVVGTVLYAAFSAGKLYGMYATNQHMREMIHECAAETGFYSKCALQFKDLKDGRAT